MFQQFSPTNFSVPDLAGLMERFYRIPTGRTLFWKILTFESNCIKNRAISGVIDNSLCFFSKRSEYPVGIFLSSYYWRYAWEQAFKATKTKREVVTQSTCSCSPGGWGGVDVKDVAPSSQLVEALTPRPCSSHTLPVSWNEATKPFKTKSG